MTRKYKKRRRAEQEQETRRRIVEALVELHGSIGPARTTVRAVAEAAGVQRATVYSHFPDEPSMYAACSAHWVQENPLPDPAGWAAIQEPGPRARQALAELYSFYAGNEQMLANVFRDQSLVEHLRPAMRMFVDYMDAAVRVVAGRARPAQFLRAAIGHALSFSTWQSLARVHGLPAGKSVSLMVTVIEQAMSR
ncbi:MAG: TetR/AcrR family transcriptional regulator [Planctomycetota bacterium]